MKINTATNTLVTVCGEPIKKVNCSTYPGSIADNEAKTYRNVTATVGKAIAAFNTICASKEIATRANLHIFNPNKTPLQRRRK